MESTLLEWLSLLLRWIHVIAGIMWIGDSLLFMWIDSHLSPDPAGRTDVAGVTWLIHGGGYYHLEKRLLVPGRLPPRLRWFWLEATSTWLTAKYEQPVIPTVPLHQGWAAAQAMTSARSSCSTGPR